MIIFNINGNDDDDDDTARTFGICLKNKNKRV